MSDRTYLCVDCDAVYATIARVGRLPRRCPECTRRYRLATRAKVPHADQNARNKRRTVLAAQWVRENRPDVWVAICAEASGFRTGGTK